VEHRERPADGGCTVTSKAADLQRAQVCALQPPTSLDSTAPAVPGQQHGNVTSQPIQIGRTTFTQNYTYGSLNRRMKNTPGGSLP
jgi:hypothetical protein